MRSWGSLAHLEGCGKVIHDLPDEKQRAEQASDTLALLRKSTT